jgi:hypothetical protein
MFQIGDEVRVKMPEWKNTPGPYLIAEIVRPKIYTLRSLDGDLPEGGAHVEEQYLRKMQ